MTTSKITIVYKDAAEHQNIHAHAVKKGFERLGHETTMTNSHEQAKDPNVCFWGWRAHKNHISKNKIILERGYLGDRFSWTSVATNGLNGNGQFWNVQDDPSRFESNFANLYKPWNPEGSYILIMGQTPNDASLRGIDLMPWYYMMGQIAQARYKLPVHFRQHPNLTNKGLVQCLQNCKKSEGNLEEALEGAKLVITFNSNSGVDALLAGKPTYVHDQGGMAYNIANNDIHQCNFKEPEGRYKFFCDLAWKQYTLEEIESGFALQGIELK